MRDLGAPAISRPCPYAFCARPATIYASTPPFKVQVLACARAPECLILVQLLLRSSCCGRVRVTAPSLDDRAWFQRRPRALVRFRPSRDNEIHCIDSQALTKPVFVPSGLCCSEPPTWVAVVELTRALACPDLPDGSSIRVRVFTVPIRSRSLQKSLAPVFVQAVVDDLLVHGSTARDLRAA